MAVTGRKEVRARAVGLVLVAAGGLLAATAKASFVPLLAVALVVAAVTAVGRAAAGSGLASAGALALVAVAPVAAGVQWQQRHFAAVNTHNLVYTAVLPDVGAAALGPLGLPPAALAAAGRAYYPDGVGGRAGGRGRRGRPGGRARRAAYGVLLAHPAAAVGALGRGLTATLGAGLSYLPSAPVTPASVPPVLGHDGRPAGRRPRAAAGLAGRAHAAVAARLVVVAGLLARGARPCGGAGSAAARRTGAAAGGGARRRRPRSGWSPPRCSATATSRSPSTSGSRPTSWW